MEKIIDSFIDKGATKLPILKTLKEIMSSPEKLTDTQLRTINTYILALTSIILLPFAFLINIENFYSPITSGILLLLSVKIFLLVSLHYKLLSVNVVQPLSVLSLALFGYFILLSDNFDPSGSLVWFIIFPPMIMFTMNLKAGTISFFVYYLSLCLLVFSPLSIYLNKNLTQPQLLRFLIAVLGAFVFSWFIEFIRFKTKSALLTAYKKNEEYAFTDVLTNLKNRRSFNKIMPEVIKKTKIDDSHFTLMLIDIDYFKKINDTYGHDMGDLALQHVSKILETQKNPTDYAFRWGGEEFVLLMPTLSVSHAEDAANRIRLKVEKTPYILDDTVLNITVSIGYYVGNSKSTQHEAITLADENVYTAKSNGRNCVIGCARI